MDVDFLKTRARYSAESLAIIDPLQNKQWTYRELNNRAENLASFLIKFGIKKGDRIALFTPNDVAYFDLLFAFTKIGAVMVPLNWRLKPIEIKKIIEDCTPQMVFYASNHKDRLESIFTEDQMIDIDSEQYEFICQTKFLSELPHIRVDKFSPAFIMYTSGSTGMPKGVMISHNGMIQNALNGIANWNFETTDSTLVSAPMFHIAAFCGLAIPLLITGGTVIIERYFSPREAIHLIQKYRITHLFMVPTMYYTLITHETFKPEAFANVKVMISGGAPASEFVQKKFETFGHTIFNSYGLTEVGPHNFRILPNEVKEHSNSIGKPIMFVSVRIVDNEFQDVEPGQIGELLISGDHMCLGYWENASESDKAFHGKYFCTGDLARQDEEGTNFARTIGLRAGLPYSVAGQAKCMVAGGVEFMSAVPMGGAEPTNNPTLQREDVGTAYPMGLTAENVAVDYNVSRADQDAFAAESHRRANEAQKAGKFEKEIIPVEIDQVTYTKNGPKVEKVEFKEDQGIRPDSSPETLGKLRTIFKADGSVTAGTASQISDGAGFVVLMSKEMVEELNIKPIARFVGFKAVGVDPKVMGIGPAYAIPEVLELSNLTLDDIDLIELNEAFAAQALASARELNINMDITNVNGGAIALGHPLGATGAILTSRLLSEMSKRPETRYGLVSMCIGVGMGAAGIFEYIGDRS